MSKNRRMGALLGLAVGDALGTTYEFQRLEQPAYPRLAVGPAVDVVGQGPFRLPPGAVTDDTQMAVCLARSLKDCKGLDIDDVAQRYVAWAKHAFDVGNQTADALSRIAGGVPPHVASRAVWQDSGRHAAGNGSLMRCAPLAIKYAHYATPPRDPVAIAEHAVDESLITHADPRCAIACAMFTVAIAHAVDDTKGKDTRPEARRDVAVAAAEFVATWLRDVYQDNRDDLAAIDAAELDLLGDLAVAAGPSPCVYGEDGLHIHGTAGFVRVALRLAFWHDAHTPAWRDAVVDVSSRGGDADTNAAIVGALLGARDGASAIPHAWRDRVLGATLPGPADWAEAHHPRHLLALV
jgi:ADP-ribosylglycohydrolase